MKAIEIKEYGGPEVLTFCDRPTPSIEAGEVLVQVAAAGVNRPDIQQRKGLYPPPPGAPDIPGLDVSGIVRKVAPDVAWPKVGDAVCALVNGGGYAEYCAVPALQCLPVPNGLSMVEAAALPEVFFTAWNNIIWLGRLAAREKLLVQGGTSGVGMAAIQIARSLRDAYVVATAGTEEKCRISTEIGAHRSVNYNDPDWPDQVAAATGGDGMDVILDGQAGKYTQIEMDLLAPDGRLVLIASHSGEFAEVNVRKIVRRRLTLTGSTLRPRPPEYKGRIGKELVAQVWPLLESRIIRMPVCATLPMAACAEAHSILDENKQIGKVVLVVEPTLTI
jgi:NADPH:quinone reductase